MNWDRIQGNWKQVAGKAKAQWGKLTDDDLDVVAGRREQLAGRIQERYGIAKDEVKKADFRLGTQGNRCLVRAQLICASRPEPSPARLRQRAGHSPTVAGLATAEAATFSRHHVMEGREENAVDHCRRSYRLVAAGAGQLVHAGRSHSRPPGHRDRRVPDWNLSRSTHGMTVARGCRQRGAGQRSGWPQSGA